MSILLFAAFVIAGTGIGYALWQQRTHSTPSLRQAVKSSHVHTLLGFLMIVAHTTEIAKVFTHVGTFHLLAALFLSTVWFAVTREQEELM